MCQADDKHFSVPSDAHLFHGLAVPAFLCSLPVVSPYKEIHSVGLFPHVHNTLFQVPFYTVTILSASHQVGEPSSSPICCHDRESPLFPVRLRSFRLGGKVMATDLGSPSSGRRRFAGKSPHSYEVVFSTKNLYSRPRSLSGAAETKRQRRQDRRKKNGKFSGSYI